MAAALNVTDTDISKVLADVYKGVRRSIFPTMTWREPTPARSYAYYGFWRCPRCQRHLEGYERKAHETVHVLRGEMREDEDAYYATIPAYWNVKVLRGNSP